MASCITCNTTVFELDQLPLKNACVFLLVFGTCDAIFFIVVCRFFYRWSPFTVSSQFSSFSEYSLRVSLHLSLKCSFDCPLPLHPSANSHTENLLWNSCLIHSLDMPKPSQRFGSENGENPLHLCSVEYFAIWDFILPLDVSDLLQTVHVKAVETSLQRWIQWPCFTSIMQGCEDACPVN